MRIAVRLLALLLILNVLLFLWPKPRVVAQVAKKEVSPQFIKLNKELFGVEDQMASQIVPEQPIGDKGSITKPEEQLTCYRLGPFLQKKNYQLAQRVLDKSALPYKKIERPAQKKQVYRVYIGPYFSKKSVLQAKAMLIEKGILDHFLRKKSEQHYIISLGIFSTNSAAKRLFDELSSDIDDLLLRNEDIDLPVSYWLDYKVNKNSPIEQSVSKVDWHDRSVKQNHVDCQKIGQL